MCGRFTLHTPGDVVARHFGLDAVPRLTARYNVAPSKPVAAVGARSNGLRGLAMMGWGLVPRWADGSGGVRPIDARAETIREKPTFRDSFALRRCLIPADGFFGWAAVGRKKLPTHFRLADGGLFAFAGIWDRREDSLTCAIITTAANDLVRPLHERMPVILRPGDYAGWLDPQTKEDDLAGLLVPYPDAEMVAVPVLPLVNKAGVEGPECLTPREQPA